MRTTSATLFLLLTASCGGGSAEPAVPACRDFRDCGDSGMKGAICNRDGRCEYIGVARGRISYISPEPGPLHVTAYTGEPGTSLFTGAKPQVPSVIFDAPTYPQAYELRSLAQGPLMLYAFVDVGNDTASTTKACVGDWFGYSFFSVVGTEAARYDYDGTKTLEIDAFIDSTITTQDLCE